MVSALPPFRAILPSTSTGCILDSNILLQKCKKQTLVKFSLVTSVTYTWQSLLSLELLVEYRLEASRRNGWDKQEKTMYGTSSSLKRGNIRGSRFSCRFRGCNKNTVGTMHEGTLWLRPQVEIRIEALGTVTKLITNLIHREGYVVGVLGF